MPMSMTMTQSAKTLPCVRSAFVPPALPLPSLTDVDAAVEEADEETAEHGADEICQRHFEPELDHALPTRGITRRFRNGTAPSLAEPRSAPLGGLGIGLVAHGQVAGIERRGLEHESDFEELVAAKHRWP